MRLFLTQMTEFFVVMNTKKKLMKLDNGFYLGAKWKKSPNFNSRPSSTTISLIVIHSISLPAGVYSGKYVENFFCNDFHKINQIFKLNQSMFLVIFLLEGMVS